MTGRRIDEPDGAPGADGEENGWESDPAIRLFGRRYRLPRSRPVRVGIGIVLVLGGLLGFLPVLGFWMVPLGVLVLSYEFALVRRWRRRLSVWWQRRRRR